MSDEIQTGGDFAVGSSLLDYMVQVNEIVMELAGAITQLQLCRDLVLDTEVYHGAAEEELHTFCNCLMNQLYRLTTFYQAASSYLVGTYNTHYQNEEQILDWIEQYLGAQEVRTDGV